MTAGMGGGGLGEQVSWGHQVGTLLHRCFDDTSRGLISNIWCPKCTPLPPCFTSLQLLLLLCVSPLDPKPMTSLFYRVGVGFNVLLLSFSLNTCVLQQTDDWLAHKSSAANWANSGFPSTLPSVSLSHPRAQSALLRRQFKVRRSKERDQG